MRPRKRRVQHDGAFAGGQRLLIPLEDEERSANIGMDLCLVSLKLEGPCIGCERFLPTPELIERMALDTVMIWIGGV
jgi:hypothetical protein